MLWAPGLPEYGALFSEETMAPRQGQAARCPLGGGGNTGHRGSPQAGLAADRLPPPAPELGSSNALASVLGGQEEPHPHQLQGPPARGKAGNPGGWKALSP